MAVLAVAQSPLLCRLLDDSPVKVHSASMDIAPGRCQAKVMKGSGIVRVLLLPVEESYQEKNR